MRPLGWAIAACVSLACCGEPADEPAGGAPDQASTGMDSSGVVALRDDGVTVLRFGEVTDGGNLPMDIDGRRMQPGEHFWLIELEVPPNQVFPVALDLRALPPGWQLRWRRESDEYNQALCDDSERRNHEGDVICGKGLVTEVVDAARPAGGELAVRAVDAAKVDLSIAIFAYPHVAERPFRNLFCCGRKNLDVDAAPDPAGIIGSTGIWEDSYACQFPTIDDAIAATPCPADF